MKWTIPYYMCVYCSVIACSPRDQLLFALLCVLYCFVTCSRFSLFGLPIFCFLFEVLFPLLTVLFFDTSVASGLLVSPWPIYSWCKEMASVLSPPAAVTCSPLAETWYHCTTVQVSCLMVFKKFLYTNGWTDFFNIISTCFLQLVAYI